MTDWHYSDNGGKFGPVTIEELKSKFLAGAITSETLVWTKSFGNSWKKYSDIPYLLDHDQCTPPPLPVAAINNSWLWCLALVPLAGLLVERVVVDSYGEITSSLTLLGYFAVNTLLGYRDEHVVRASGRTPVTFWAAGFFVPLYLYARNKRIGGNQLPLLTWVAGLAFAAYASAGFTMPYFGLSTPGCASGASISKVKEIFPQIPLNVARIKAVEVTNVQSSGTEDKRICKADVITSAGASVPVSYTIELRGNEYYYWLNLGH